MDRRIREGQVRHVKIWSRFGLNFVTDLHLQKGLIPGYWKVFGTNTGSDLKLRQLFFEPMVSISFVIEGMNLDVAGTLV
jgi:hypothetical protein